MQMKQLFIVATLLSLTACASTKGDNSTAARIKQEMDAAAKESSNSTAKADAVNDALLPPLAVTVGRADSKSAEARFDLAVNNTSASQVFMAIVSGTRYSMLVHPEVSGSISLNLKDVTVFDALESIRELYGYDYKVDGSRIYIQPLTMQTRIFQVNYLTGQRSGRSSLRVASGSVADVGSSGASNAAGAQTNQSSSDQSNRDSTRVTTSSNSDFWEDLSKSLQAIVGSEKGRSVIISPMSGVIVVRAMPDELNSVSAYLKASQISVERQVILEAKIVEVQLNESFQSGVNWGGFGSLQGNSTSNGSFGVLSPGTTLQPSGTNGAPQNLSNSLLAALPGASMSTAAAAGGALFGLAFQTSNFAMLLNFLETQGNVHVLSSPRIATLNNQKAVLKIGTDEFFVTKITGGSVTTGAAGSTSSTVTSPTVETTAFFSGIMLDVTPKIDENNEIVLHVHPSVSQVGTVNKTISLGSAIGTFNLPVPSSNVSETDSVVRARDGQIVAIGGLMREATVEDESGLPYLSKMIFGQTSKRTEKRELVILLKPTVVDSDKDWSDDIARSNERINKMTR